LSLHVASHRQLFAVRQAVTSSQTVSNDKYCKWSNKT